MTEKYRAHIITPASPQAMCIRFPRIHRPPSLLRPRLRRTEVPLSLKSLRWGTPRSNLPANMSPSNLTSRSTMLLLPLANRYEIVTHNVQDITNSTAATAVLRSPGGTIWTGPGTSSGWDTRKALPRLHLFLG